MDLKELEESAALNRKVLETAFLAFGRYLGWEGIDDGTPFGKSSTGVSNVKRGNEVREVHYVELADGDDTPTLRIEVYTK